MTSQRGVVVFSAFALIVACGSSAKSPLATSSSGGSAGNNGAGTGGTHADAGSDAPVGPMPGTDATVNAFSKTPVFFTGSDNQRQVDAPVSFPETGAYEKIMLHIALDCPVGGCDVYDRFGSLGVVTTKGQDGGPDTVVEVMRFITPFGVGASWDLDVTDLRPLLTGDLTMRVFIDTWVGPGSQYGSGWLATATFTMTGDVPSPLPIANVPVWEGLYVTYGDPSKPISMSVPPGMVTVPKASSYALRNFITGHGQGNAGNCSEFCPKTHTITVGTKAHTQKIWRTDCATTAAPGQQGTYQYSRAGWCPGADVKPWTFDVTADIGSESAASLSYDVEAYTNTCRPDAMPCTGCTLGTSCAYDGGAHTEPYYELSSLVIAYQ
jgi:hypothetical protein